MPPDIRATCHFGAGLFAAILLVGSSKSPAQTNSESARLAYRVKRWTTDDGLPQNRISCLTQTHDGYLWMGTWFGLVRFDGVHFTVFDKFNTPEMADDDSINAVAEDSQGTLWIGTRGGLLSYRKHQFRRCGPLSGLSDQRVWWLAPCQSGGVWVRAGNSVGRLAEGRLSKVWDLPTTGESGQPWLQQSANGELQIVMVGLWLSLSPQGDLRTNRIEWPFRGGHVGLPSRTPGTLWVASLHGLHCYERGAWNMIRARELRGDEEVQLFEDHSGKLWIDSRIKGLYCVDQSVDLEERSAHSMVTCMTEDREGNTWLGTEQGLVQLQPRRVRTYTSRDGLPSDEVWSVCEGTNGTIWAATRGGLGAIRQGQALSLASGEPVPDNSDSRDWCVWPEAAGVLVGHSGVGVLEYLGKDAGYLSRHPLSGQTPRALYRDRLGQLWIGTSGGVVAFKDGEAVLTYAKCGGKTLDVRCILQDKGGTTWIGTQGQGLVRLNDGRLDVLTTRDGLNSDRVWCLHEDSCGGLWIGTENGLNRLGPQRLSNGGRLDPSQGGARLEFSTYTRSQGLLENAINCILEDALGYLWLSGQRGIYRVKRAQLEAIGEGDTVECTPFGTADGMETSETNGEGQPSGWKGRDGRLWFPTQHGLVVVDPKTIQINDVPAPVVIEQVKAGDEVIFGDGLKTEPKVRKPPFSGTLNRGLATPAPAAIYQFGPGRARTLEFHYTGNSFADPARVRFRYRLRGWDRDWREAGNSRMAFYTYVRPGTYQFEVKACNNHGLWSASPEIFAFTLAPHFWETWPFGGLCAAAVIGLAAAVQGYRLRWQHRLLKVEHQQALANERNRIARDLHDDLGTALTGLALELDVTRRETNGAAALSRRLGTSAERVRTLAERMREVVWAINPRCDTVSSLASFLEQQAGHLLRSTNLRGRIEFPEDIPPLPLDSETRHQLALGVREALTNVVRHAQATEAVLGLSIEREQLLVRVTDNGVGCPLPSLTSSTRGLANLRERMARLGGSFECASELGKGTALTFRVPLAGAVPDKAKRL